MNNLKGFNSLIIAGALFGFSGILIRWIAVELSDFQQTMLRMLIAAIMGLVIFIVRRFPNYRQQLDFTGVRWWSFLLFLVAFPMIMVCMTLSVNLIKVASAVFYLYIGKHLGAIAIDIIFFKEHFDKRRIASVFLIFLGLIFFMNPFEGIGFLSAGMIYGVVGGLLAAVDGAYRKIYSGKIDRWFLVFTQMFTGVAIMIPLLLMNQEVIFPAASMNIWLMLLLFGVLIVATQVLMLIGYKNFDINLGMIIITSELIFAMIFAYFFFAEQPSLNEIIGSSLIIAAIVNRNIDLSK